MSMTIEQPEELQLLDPASDRLRNRMAAVRLGFTWFGHRKSLSPEQRAEAAERFGAEAKYMSATKKLLDTKHPAYRLVTSLKTRAVTYWRSVTLPFPEAGIRLIRQQDLAGFDVQLTTLRAELEEAVRMLDEQYAELRQAARQRLGRLYREADYPETLQGLFAIEWDYPSIEPPEYLRDLSPELYEQEQQRVSQRFDEAVRLAEEAFCSELAKLVSHLSERLTGEQDGKPKVFRDTAVTNLREFFDRFRMLNVRSNEQLDELVRQCQRIVGGIEPQDLRDSHDLRSHLAGHLGEVQTSLDAMLVDRPRRNIIRKPR